MTESSQGSMRGYGPFPEGAEPTAPIGMHQPPAAHVPPQPTGGHDGQPMSETQASGPPSSGPPSSGIPAGVPSSGIPAGVPSSGIPAGRPPSSGAPSGGNPSYGPFQAAAPDPFGEKQEGWTETPYGFNAPPGRRIEPSPPPERNRLVVGILAGLVVGLLLFGTGGYFAGRATAPKTPEAAPAPAPTATGGLGVFEQSQVTINREDFAGTGLTTMSEGFLPYLSACARPKANAGEKLRVRCTLDGMSAIFVEYNSVADRDKARVKALGQAVDARSLTPGVAPAVEQATPSGRVTGNYVEYAYRLTESGATRTVAGIWWDDAQTPVAGYLLAYWEDGLGAKWDPMRDLWSRYA
ncbi:hypothetical protein [Paractinoplanes abujensis]|uniref:Uncharacterized protein n=1 Tax=Paractinoplanes abujensis TaxID=882441 RepID=A0A7W7CZ90_9ACTN|nr:hypothetical protein [Actinoplanes abujensis]MBB4697410.1 hypothetical protein [Actinoplanes abujensis]